MAASDPLGGLEQVANSQQTARMSEATSGRTSGHRTRMSLRSCGLRYCYGTQARPASAPPEDHAWAGRKSALGRQPLVIKAFSGKVWGIGAPLPSPASG